MSELRILSSNEWDEQLTAWAKEHGGILDRQLIIRLAERDGIDVHPSGDHGWLKCASTMGRMKQDGRLENIDRGTYRIRC